MRAIFNIYAYNAFEICSSQHNSHKRNNNRVHSFMTLGVREKIRMYLYLCLGVYTKCSSLYVPNLLKIKSPSDFSSTRNYCSTTIHFYIRKIAWNK